MVPLVSQSGHVSGDSKHLLYAYVKSSCSSVRCLSQKFAIPSFPGDFQFFDLLIAIFVSSIEMSNHICSGMFWLSFSSCLIYSAFILGCFSSSQMLDQKLSIDSLSGT